MIEDFLDISFLQTDGEVDWFIVFKAIIVAYVQGVFLFIGLIIALLGCAVLWREIFSGKNHRFYSAKITGVRSGFSSLKEGGRSAIYYPVFEYVDRHGQLIMAESLSGSSLLRNKFPGTTVKVKVDIETPDWVTSVGIGWKIGGAIGLLCGLAMILGGTFFQSITALTLVIWGLMAIKPLLKLRKIIIPRKDRLSKFDFKILRKTERNNDRKDLPILSKDDVLVLLRKEDRSQQLIFPFVVLIACGIIYAGFGFLQTQDDMLSSYESVDGVYVGEKSFPERRIEFVTKQGIQIRLTDDFAGLYPSTFSTQAVSVYYDPANPYRHVVSRGIWQGAGFKLMIGLGGLMLLQSLRSALRRRSRWHRV
ncbi:MAG: hypothetical protein RBR86_00765 [Pseudobdellovibrionaceae bacterium]|jgi:hypothetical protein|nr:hypothetical protein [Pseudobdellovibrionaceae bacterium]